jgi:membrane-associated phospholipid phosphatase
VGFIQFLEKLMLLNTAKRKIIAIFAAFLFATMISYLFLDKTLALDVENNISPSHRKLFDLLSFPIEPLVIPLYILLFLKIFEHAAKAIKLLINFGAATLTTIASVSILKFILARPRPSFYLTQGIAQIMPFHLNSSFVSMPSGHASSAGLLSALIMIVFKGKMRLLMILPTFMSLFRVVSLKHYLSDVILGYGIGFCIALTFHLLERNLFDKLKEVIWKNGKIV